MTPTLWMLSATLLFSLVGVFVKLLQRLPVWEVVFFRAFINTLWLLPWAAKHWDPSWKREIKPLLIRALSGFTSMVLFFYAIAHLKIADAFMLNYSSPIPTILLSAWLLKERLDKVSMCFVGVAIAGIALILKPAVEISNLAGLAGILSAIIAAIAYVSMKRATRNIHSDFIVFTFAAISSALCFVPMLMVFTLPTSTEWLWIFATGACATFAQIAMTRSYAGLPASVASPLMLSAVVFSAILGWLVWDEVPDAFSICGALLVVFGLIMVTRRANRATL